MKLLFYCTKEKPYLVKKEINYIDTKRKEVKYLVGNQYAFDNWINGTIPCECDCEVEDMFEIPWEYGYITTSRDDYENIEKECCLSHLDLKNYLGDKLGKAIYIKNLHAFDEPRELAYSTCDNDAYYYSEKYDKKRKCKVGYAITKAPQNMMYVFDGNEKKVLISIHPEQLCKILNGEKTIEVRKKVLKCMEEGGKNNECNN